MIFNSIEFIFFFLPTTFLAFLVLGFRGHRRAALAWLVIASLFFYGWWNPVYLLLITGSILFNFKVGNYLGDSTDPSKRRKFFLIFGVAINLLLLGYFKYANFFIGNINYFFETDYHIEKIILPLAISFFTFQQVAFLVDNYYGRTREKRFLDYCFFVSFFPQLIAGPIVQHSEISPQIKKDIFGHPQLKNVAIGLSIFFLGLFKKVVLADSIAVHSSPVFKLAETGTALTFFESWAGMLGYTLQIYFDFSGYSDMAVGLAQIFGIRLPINFFSPYKSINIIQFWRRWHITLSRFLRLYLYFPLGGSRKGRSRQFFNLMFTMFLGGLWHGAGWTFVLWGTIHGFYLVINHAWQNFRRLLGQSMDSSTPVGRSFSRVLTFFAVAFAWVFFRAETLEGAFAVFRGMFGFNGILLDQWMKPYLPSLPSVFYFGNHAFGSFGNGAVKLLILLIIVFALPNSQQFMQRYLPSVENYLGERSIRKRRIQWRPTPVWALLITVICLASITNILNLKTTEFLYFQF